MVVGDWHLIEQPDQMERPWTGANLPSFYFFGPQLKPTITWNPGEVYSVGIGFLPGALSAMTGLDVSSFTGRSVPPEEPLPQPILEAFRNFFDAVPREGPKRSFSVLQDNIEIMWARVRPAGTRSRKCSERGRGVVQRATVTGFGRSARQIARRVKSWTGVGQKDLQGWARMEQLSLKWIEAARKGDVDWADLAAASGFADQAHMIRRYQKYTGFTPKQAHERVRRDEAFWLYRLLAQVADEHLRGKKVSRSWTPLARLDRDRPDLAAEVRAGTKSADAVAIEAGFRKKPSAFDQVMRALKMLKQVSAA